VPFRNDELTNTLNDLQNERIAKHKKTHITRETRIEFLYLQIL